jgi:ribonuclease P protein component
MPAPGPAPRPAPGCSAEPGIASSAAASKPARLKRRKQFLEAARSGRKAAIGGVVLQARARDDNDTVRVGFTVTRKVGNAVVRNRSRRRLKEAARLVMQEHAMNGFDLVLIGRDSTRRRAFTVLQQDIRRALERTKVL